MEPTWNVPITLLFGSQKNNGSSWDHSGTLVERSVFAGLMLIDFLSFSFEDFAASSLESSSFSPCFPSSFSLFIHCIHHLFHVSLSSCTSASSYLLLSFLLFPNRLINVQNKCVLLHIF